MNHNPDNIHLPEMPLPPELPPDDGCTGEGRGRGHTYTASEVKVAYELGRKDALEEVAREMGVDRWDDEPRKYVTVQIDWDTYNLLQGALGAASDATSGVPGHPEVSEAVRSPQEPCGHPDCPCVHMHSRPEGNTP